MKLLAHSGQTVALALTWDGARWPAKSLPAKARAFLSGKAHTAKSLAKLFSEDQVREVRICWVPLLKGGSDVLSEPFLTPNGKRIPYQPIRTTSFGDILGVIYRRASA